MAMVRLRARGQKRQDRCRTGIRLTISLRRAVALVVALLSLFFFCGCETGYDAVMQGAARGGMASRQEGTVAWGAVTPRSESEARTQPGGYADAESSGSLPRVTTAAGPARAASAGAPRGPIGGVRTEFDGGERGGSGSLVVENEPGMPEAGSPPAEDKPVAAETPRPFLSPAATAPRPAVPERRRPSVRPPLAGSSPAANFPIQLSAGVALPQTLPTGTAMGFSVDYRWAQGQPDPNTPYFWVIEAAGAPPLRQAVRLDRQGTLQGFALELRPEHGPFQTYITDASGRRLSPTVPLR